MKNFINAGRKYAPSVVFMFDASIMRMIYYVSIIYDKNYNTKKKADIVHSF